MQDALTILQGIAPRAELAARHSSLSRYHTGAEQRLTRMRADFGQFSTRTQTLPSPPELAAPQVDIC